MATTITTTVSLDKMCCQSTAECMLNDKKTNSITVAEDNEQPPDETSLRQQFISYVERSTMHGVGHLVSSVGIRQRTYWTILVMFGLVMATVHLRFHVKNYLESPVFTQIEHESHDFIFPDVTFCSLTPTTGRMYQRSTRKHRFGSFWEDYIVVGVLYTQEDLGSMNFTQDTDLHRKWIYRQRASYSSHEKSFYPSDEMVFDCRFQGQNCKSWFTLMNDPHYWNCYTFKPRNRIFKSTNPEDGLHIIAYTATEDINELIDRKLNMRNVKNTFFSQTNITNFKSSHNTGFNFYARILLNNYEPAGIKIVIHEGNTNSHAKDQGFVLTNGEYAKIGLEMYMEQRLNQADKQCAKIPPTKSYRQSIYFNGSASNLEMIRTEQDCVLENVQRQVERLCGCRSHVLPILSEARTALCYNFTDTLNALLDIARQKNITIPQTGIDERGNISKREMSELINFGTRISSDFPEGEAIKNQYEQNLRCHDNFLAKRKFAPAGDEGKGSSSPAENEQNKCLVGCQNSVYKYYLSSVYWPRDTDIFSLMRDIIMPNIKHDNGSFKDIANDFIQTKRNDTTWDSSTEVIRRNFIRVVIHPMKLKSNVHMEKYSYNFLEVLSEVGGIMGLYLGMSILTLFEIVDLLMDFIGRCFDKTFCRPKSKTKKADNDTEMVKKHHNQNCLSKHTHNNSDGVLDTSHNDEKLCQSCAGGDCMPKQHQPNLTIASINCSQLCSSPKPVVQLSSSPQSQSGCGHQQLPSNDLDGDSPTKVREELYYLSQV